MHEITKKPKVTVHMCTYNRVHFIQQAIDSVLSQTFTNWELLILDDASTDDTEEMIKRYISDTRIKYIKNQHNLGITKNRNKALSLSSGEYISVLDSDDYWVDKDKLAKQVTFLDTHTDHALVGTYMNIVNEKNTILKRVKYPLHSFIIKKTLLIKNMFCHSSVMYRKQEVVEIGGYDESLAIWEDYDLWLRIGLKYKFANIGTYATNYRIHDNQSNSQKTQIGKNTQAYIIHTYKNLYSGYVFAKIINMIRNIKNHGK